MPCNWKPRLSFQLPMVLAGLVIFLQGAAIASGFDKASRPRITGIDHVTVYVTDLKKSHQFYSEILGLTEKCPQFRGPGTCLLVRPSNQRVLLKQITAQSGDLKNWVGEIAFATDDVAQMRKYLATHGFSPGVVRKD